jgi:hypothetical protein
MADIPQDRPGAQGGEGDSLAPTDQPVSAPGENSAAHTQARYQLGEAQGPQHHLVRDRVLDRRAMARVSSLGDADELEQEARFLAHLDHVGTPAILDFVRGDAGAMLITRRTEGITLAEAIRQARTGLMPPELASPAAVVQMMMKLCDVIAAAHAQGVVHHALAPERILLGSYGQLVVQDWSEAIAEKKHPATLRYVSIAQSTPIMGLDGLHQDIRSIGACLFESLVLRQAQPAGDDLLGFIQPDERVRLPAQIEAIVRQAMASDPMGGYRSVAQLGQDLSRFIDGSVPVAYAPGLLARCAACLRRQRKPLLAAISGLVVVGLVVGGLWGRQLWRAATWRTIASEDFSDQSWKQRWVEPPTTLGMFAVQGGRLVSTADRDAFLIFRQRLTTPAAIEYSGEILAGAQPCDLSVQWSEASGVAEDPARFAQEGRSYMIQAGAFGNSFCAIFQNPGRRLLAHANRQLEVGRTYRFRVELDGTRISMLIDGERILDYVDDFPTQSGFISLYGFYPGKAFDDVRVLQQWPGNQPGMLATGDAAFLENRFEVAAGRYAEVAEICGGTSLGQKALHRKGLAEWSMGAFERAGKTWDKVTETDLVKRIECVRLEALFNTDQRTPHLSRFEEQYRDSPDLRDSLRQTWRMIIQQQLDAPQRNPLVIDYFLGLRERLFPEDASARYVAAQALLTLHRYTDVLDRFPDQRNTCARAMLALCRTEQLVATPWVGNDERMHALGIRGEFAQVLASAGQMPAWRARTLIKLGRAEDALKEDPSGYPALLHLGRAQELLDQSSIKAGVANEALICLGRLQEAAGEGLSRVPGSGSNITAMLMLGQVELAERVGKQPRTAIRFMQAAERHDDQSYAKLHDQVTLPVDLAGTYGWFDAALMLPFVDELHGDPGAMDRLARPLLDLLSGTYCRAGWFVVRAVLGDSPVTEVMRMPSVNEALAWTHLATAMRAELEKKPEDALRAYAAFAAMPIHQRLLALNAPDPDIEWFVAWRLRELRGQVAR